MVGFEATLLFLKKPPRFADIKSDEIAFLIGMPGVSESRQYQHHLVLVTGLPISMSLEYAGAEIGSPFGRISNGGIAPGSHRPPAFCTPLSLQVENHFHGIVDQQRLDLRGHADVIDQIADERHRKKTGQWRLESILRIDKT
ncbi:hypothetical protein AK821_05645 [Pseudomonas sp. RIT-PI-r]|nr:hypothetical protein AK821_05645 [Pseudomonas sp. RIT-PI-r]